MCSTASKVLTQIKDFGSDVVFTTRQLLPCGTRAAVDHALSRLVSKNVIRRLAVGVFIAVAAVTQSPSIYDIASAKAIAFRKRIFDQKTILVESRLVHSFSTDSCKSSFNTVLGRIFFIPASTTRLAEVSQNTPVLSSSCKPQVSHIQNSPSIHLTLANTGQLISADVNHLHYLPKRQNEKPVCVIIANDAPITSMLSLTFANAVRLLRTLVLRMNPGGSFKTR